MKKIFSVMVVALMLALGATRAWSQVQMSLNSATPTGGPAGSGPTYMSLADATLAAGVPMPRHPGPVHAPMPAGMPVGMPVVPASYSGAVGCDDCGVEIASCEGRSHQRKCIGMWFDAEYLLWWGDKRNVPVL